MAKLKGVLAGFFCHATGTLEARPTFSSLDIQTKSTFWINKMPASENPEKIRVPAPILTIVHIIMVILLGNLSPLPIPVPAFVPWLGLGVAGLGLVSGILASVEFRRIRTTLDLKKPSTGLVTSGIYRYTRNPVYLGFVFMLVGFSLSMRTYWGIILMVPLVTLMNALVIEKEETGLEMKFKTQYTDYKSRVNRWL